MSWGLPRSRSLAGYSRTRRRANGTARIQRETYNTSYGGLSQRGEWWAASEIVRKRSKGKCEARGCLNKGKDVHHILSLRNGGTTTPSNMIHLCEACHCDRHNHMKRKAKK